MGDGSIAEKGHQRLLQVVLWAQAAAAEEGSESYEQAKEAATTAEGEAAGASIFSFTGFSF